ncbi:hypothetical protein H6F98_17790 [Microcoleus sp. FACHB-SPT15]|uniref:hypothetical protein n=1 Tax=Microcoleus sp. FACHB-SPT15 TaxID=2692830 RepID=UPI001783316F|nr:hypothetical protein [Microcoleus sp. FACHB-SPT15]MBD1807286.1 hypothetical protein [Microcoleus sp. FACHB-SPT15]
MNLTIALTNIPNEVGNSSYSLRHHEDENLFPCEICLEGDGYELRKHDEVQQILTLSADIAK